MLNDAVTWGKTSDGGHDFWKGRQDIKGVLGHDGERVKKLARDQESFRWTMMRAMVCKVLLLMTV